MMQGDAKVDELMRPVNAAIKWHVKDRDAATEIYNRAYEAVMEVHDSLNIAAAVTAKQIAQNAKNLQRAEAAEARANKAEAYAKKLEEKIPETNLALAQTSLRAEAAEARAERYEDALQQIHNWAKAYPLDVFPEPDFKRVREALEAAGITLDSVSASNMRHVITGVARIVEKALKGGEG